MPPLRPSHKERPQHITTVYLPDQAIAFDNRIAFVWIFHKLFGQSYHIYLEIHGLHLMNHKIRNLSTPMVMIGGVQGDFQAISLGKIPNQISSIIDDGRAREFMFQ